MVAPPPPQEHNTHMGIPMFVHHKPMLMPRHAQTLHPYHHYHLPIENHTLYYPQLKQISYWSHFCQDCDPTTVVQRNKLKYQTLVGTLEDVGWYLTLTILTTTIQGSIRMNEHHRPIWTMLDPFYAHVCMHATNPLDSYQILDPTHAQQM